MRHFLTKGLLSAQLTLLSVVTFAQQETCRTVMPLPQTQTAGCTQDYLTYMPTATTNTVVVNVVVNLRNSTALPNSYINGFQNSDIAAWISSFNTLYGGLTPAVANVGSTPFISDTHIRLNLLGVYRAGDPPIPGASSAITLYIDGGVDGNGAPNGFAIAHPDDGYVEFFLVAGDFAAHGSTISYRYKWLAHEMGHMFGLLHPDGAGYYYQGCACGDDMFDDTYYPDCASGGACGTNVPIVGFYYPNGTQNPGSAINCGNGVVSNNIMGYSCEDYLSPKQIAYMHYTIYNKYYGACSVPPVSYYCPQGREMIMEVQPGLPVTISGQYVSSGDIYINPGAILTITGCVNIRKDRKITVAPGGKLVVDGGVIDCACPNAMWAGIEIRGNAQQFQLYGNSGYTSFDPYQGVCELKNGAKILNAKTGVYVGGRVSPTGDPNVDLPYSGGVLLVDNTTFSGCYTGVQFMPYSKMKSTKSYIRNSFFNSAIVKDASLNIGGAPTPTQQGIYLNSIGPVEIKGNVFNSLTVMAAVIDGDPTYNIYNEKLRGTAITAENAALRALNNQFNDYRHAIKTSNNTTTLRAIFIRHNKFNNNLFGITCNTTNAKIDSNYFRIPQGLIDPVNIPAGSSPYPYGVYLDNSSGFTLETDTFMTVVLEGGTGGDPTGRLINTYPVSTTSYPAHESYGLIVRNSGSIGGEVKTNCEFKNMYVAFQAEQSNPNLQVRCNKFENNIIAWRINPTSVTDVLGPQGTSCSMTTGSYRANNTFAGCSTGKDQFESYLNTAFNYYYWDNTTTTADLIFKPCTAAVNNHVNLLSCNATTNDPTVCPASANRMHVTLIREKLMSLIEEEKLTEAVDYLSGFTNDDEAKKILIGYYYETGDLQRMEETISQLENTDNSPFIQFFTILKQLKKENKDIKQMSALQVNEIEKISATNTQAGSYARATLEFMQKKENNISPEVPFETTVYTNRTEKIMKAVEREAELGLNIPNPANNSTLIHVYVPENAFSARIVVLNCLGQPVAEKNLLKGELQVEFNTSDFAQGIYFYTMFVNNQAVSSKRMMIVK